MHVTMGNETLADGSFEVKKAFDYYDETGTLPKTSGTTPDDNLKVFSKIRQEHPDAHINILATRQLPQRRLLHSLKKFANEHIWSLFRRLYSI